MWRGVNLLERLRLSTSGEQFTGNRAFAGENQSTRQAG
jgi:hypothetical protein